MEKAERITTRSMTRIKAAWIWLAAVALVVAMAAVFVESWWPPLRERIAALVQSDSNAESDAGAGEQAGHGHEHSGHNEASSIELSEQARKNIGLKIDEVVNADYDRSLSIPGIVVQRPGKSRIDITAPLTGMVTEIYVTEGQTVKPGDKLFDLRLTHEEVVQAQKDLLRTGEELKVIRREVKRLEVLTAGEAVARKSLLERQYEEQKQEAVFRSQREALRLHGLADEQIQEILDSGRLLPSFTVTVPEPHNAEANEAPVTQLQELRVNRGEHVNTGGLLAILANHSSLLIEGRAFEHDAQQISIALERGWKVSAVLETRGGNPDEVKDLELLYMSNEVEPESRALHFYVELPNTPLRDRSIDGRRYLVWRFKPGQRMQIRVPVERWEKQIVVPIDAIAQDGAETFVFRENSKRFDRQPVHVVYRDQYNAVIANDGSLYPGDRVAMNGAHQLLVALKNKSGGGVDPHAGHTH